MIVPTALSQEEKDLKVFFEKLRNDRKNFEAALKKAGAGKLDQRQSKTESVDDAELNREEALKKIALGKITFEKSDEKQIFKRNKVAKKESNPHDLSDFGRNESTSSASLRSPTNFPIRESSRGPTLYIRGYNLNENSLNQSFSKFGQIRRCHVEERQGSAFITFSTVEEADAAMKEMNGQLVRTQHLNIKHVSFARRQNQDNRNRQQWHQQTFVSAGFNSTSNEVPKPEVLVEREVVKRKLPEPTGVDLQRGMVNYEEGELFDGTDIE